MSNEMRRLANLFEQCPVGVVALDRDGRVCHINPALAAALAIDVPACVGQAPSAELVAKLPFLAPPAASGAAPADTLLDVWRYTVAEISAADVAAGVEGPLRVYYVHEELAWLRAENRRLQEELEQLRLKDPHTGLLSARALMLLLEPEVARSRRYDNPLAIIRLSLDYTDDASGPAAARAVSHCLKEQLRWADAVAQFSARDFAVVLPETDAADAAKLADKLAAQTAQLAAVHASRTGVAAWRKGDDAKGLLERAEQAVPAAGETTTSD